MTDEEINRAVAKHLGWKWRDHPDTLEKTKGWALPHFVLNPAGELVSPHSVPNYAGDLNAMHEAEKTAFASSTAWAEFALQLMNVLMAADMSELDGMTCVLQASARQRAEAFLLTVGKWKGEA